MHKSNQIVDLDPEAFLLYILTGIQIFQEFKSIPTPFLIPTDICHRWVDLFVRKLLKPNFLHLQ